MIKSEQYNTFTSPLCINFLFTIFKSQEGNIWIKISNLKRIKQYGFKRNIKKQKKKKPQNETRH